MLNELFASLYETLFYTNDFSGDLFNENLYTIIGLVMVVTSLLIPVLYYKIIDTVKFSKISIWLVFLSLSVIFNFLFCYVYSYNYLSALGLDYSSGEYLSFSFINSYSFTALTNLLHISLRYFFIILLSISLYFSIFLYFLILNQN